MDENTLKAFEAIEDRIDMLRRELVVMIRSVILNVSAGGKPVSPNMSAALQNKVAKAVPMPADLEVEVEKESEDKATNSK